MNRALFLDRDGVINKNLGYVHTKDQFIFIDGIFELGKAAFKKKYKIIVITNQSGIGRGYYSEDDFHSLSKWMSKKFKNNGVLIDRIFFSPFHPTEAKGSYLKDDYSRKPNPGMIIEAKKEYDLDLQESILIGDSLSDIQAGINAGVGRNILFNKDKGLNKEIKAQRVDSLLEAIKYL